MVSDDSTSNVMVLPAIHRGMHVSAVQQDNQDNHLQTSGVLPCIPVAAVAHGAVMQRRSQQASPGHGHAARVPLLACNVAQVLRCWLPSLPVRVFTKICIVLATTCAAAHTCTTRGNIKCYALFFVALLTLPKLESRSMHGRAARAAAAAATGKTSSIVRYFCSAQQA
jgi:hypothetical protein